MKLSTKSILLAAVAISALGSQALAESLKVGAAAPALKVAKWVKGKPVSKFEKGKVYVVEFWATWCGPCKQSIPHLTELAQKYKNKVTFTGVSVWETDGKDKKDTTYYKKVEDFVKDMGAKMDYNVALDGPDGTMSESWMKAANQNGIPTAFVIDQEGKVAWIGHPMAELGDVLDQVLAGKYDASAAAQAKAASEGKMKKLQDDMGEVMQLMGSNKNDEALTKLDAVIAGNPDFAKQLLPFKFELLLHTDEAKAYDFAKHLGENELKDDSMGLNQIAWTIVEAKDPIKKPDLDVAIALAQRAADLAKGDDVPMVLDTLAFAHFKKGHIDEAITLQTKAVGLLKGTKIPADTQKEITDRLEQFKKAKGG